MGEEDCENQARSRRGRGLSTHVTNNVGEATRGKGQKIHKAKQQQKSNVSCLKHADFKCIYTNADSFINKFASYLFVVR